MAWMTNAEAIGNVYEALATYYVIQGALGCPSVVAAHSLSRRTEV